MLVHPIIDKLQSLRFFGMRTAFEEQMQTAASRNASGFWSTVR
jgi:hypothetical protein